VAPARLTRPLDPIYQGSTLAQPIQFFNEDRTPKDMAAVSSTLFMARKGVPAATEQISGTYLGSGLFVYGEPDEVTAEFEPGRYDIEVRNDLGGVLTSVLVGEITVVKGAASDGASGAMPGALQPGSVVGVVISATGLVQVVMVDRVVVEGGGTGPGGPIGISDVTGLTAALADKATDAELTSEAGFRSAADDALDGRLDTAEAKLAGIATGATANMADAALLARGNHTGTQAISTVSGLQGALDAKAPLASPALTGVPTAPTPTPGDASTQIANMAAVSAAIQAIVGMSPADLDTLAEIAARIQSGESNYAALVTTIAGKLAKSANLSDVDDVTLARSNLGLGSAATQASSAFQPADTDLTAIAALTTTTYGRAFLALADAAAGRTALGLGTAATQASTAFQAADTDLTAIAALTTTTYGRAFLALADAAAARTAMGLGTAAQSAAGDFQPVDADLTAIAALSTTTFGRSLLAAADAAALRTLAGLGNSATRAVGTSAGTVAAGDDSRFAAATPQLARNIAGGFFAPRGFRFSATNITNIANRLYLLPWSLDLNLTGLGFNINTGAALAAARLGLYASDANGLPSTLIEEAAENVFATTTGNMSALFAAPRRSGTNRWVGIVLNQAVSIRIATSTGDGNATIGSVNMASTTVDDAVYVSHTYGALPSDLTGASLTKIAASVCPIVAGVG